MSQKTRWLIYSVAGLLVLGFGFSLLGEAIIKKWENDSHWVHWGTVALVVTNSGICLIGQAVIEKIKFEREKTKNQQ